MLDKVFVVCYTHSVWNLIPFTRKVTQDMIQVYDPDAAKASQSKSIVRKAMDLITFGGTTALMKQGEEHVGITHVKAAVEVIRETGESLVTGAALGVINATGGLERNGKPVDAIAGGVANVAGIAMGSSPLGRTLRTSGNVCMGVFAMRKSDAWTRARMGKTGGSHHGDFGADKDPIIEAGADLD